MRDDLTASQPDPIEAACAAFNAAPSSLDPLIANALGIIAEFQRIAAALGPLIPLATELRAERDRIAATHAQMQGEVCRLRALGDALEAMLDARLGAGQSDARKCGCAPGGLSVVLLGGYCAKCGGKA